jgi:hypothetical protein
MSEYPMPDANGPQSQGIQLIAEFLYTEVCLVGLNSFYLRADDEGASFKCDNANYPFT